MHYLESKFPSSSSALAARRVKTALAPNTQQIKQELKTLTNKVSEALQQLREQLQGSLSKISNEYPSLALKVALAASLYETRSGSVGHPGGSSSIKRNGDNWVMSFASSIPSPTSSPAVNPASSSDRSTAPVAADSSGGSRTMSSETHLVVFVNGLFGSPSNWAYICEEMQTVLNRSEFLLHPSRSNTLLSTYEGIDVCGTRLAEEIQAVVHQHPNLQRISVVGHSMGGLMARYALGRLYDPVHQTIAGLQPVHFITMATPHLGCDADGEAQVPFIGWSSMLPLVGNGILRLLQLWSTPVASMVLRRTGQQFFLADNSGENPASAAPPLLVQMSEDIPEDGRYYYSALASFRTRTCYANTMSDHLVGWANSSLRFSHQLPPLPPQHLKAKGVVLEDPVETAFCHMPGPTGQTMREMFPPGQGLLSSARVSMPDLQARHYSTRSSDEGSARTADATAPAAALLRRRTSAPGDGRLEVAAADSGFASQPRPSAAESSVPGRAALQRGSQSTRGAVGGLHGAISPSRAYSMPAAVDAGTGQRVAVAGDGGSGSPSGAPWRDSRHDSADDGRDALASRLLKEIRTQRVDGLFAGSPTATPLSANSSLEAGHLLADLADWEPRAGDGGDGWPEEGGVEAVEELERGVLGMLRSASVSSTSSGYATARSSMSMEDWAADVNDALNGFMFSINSNLNDPEHIQQRQEHTTLMLERLQALPWRRIDVCFKGATWGFAHNNIQVTRKWWNFEGKSVARHLAEQMREMDLAVKALEQSEAPPHLSSTDRRDNEDPAAVVDAISVVDRAIAAGSVVDDMVSAGQALAAGAAGGGRGAAGGGAAGFAAAGSR